MNGNVTRAYALLLGLLLALSSAAQDAVQNDATGTSGKSFQDFSLILQRNIFNPDRRPPLSPAQLRDDRSRTAPVDQISLLGVYIEDGRALAIFGGSKQEYNVTLNPGGRIAGYTVGDIGTDGISLAKDDQKIKMKVGTSLRREEGGDWKYSNDSGYRPEQPGSGSSTGASTSSSSTSDTGSPGLSREEILRRLMERRRQEVEQ